MTKLTKIISAPLISLIFLLNMSSAGMADTTVSAEVGFIFNTLLFLICGFLVMFMAAGFAMLESGMVTSKSVSVICAKNIGLFSIAGIMFWLVGYNLAYGIDDAAKGLSAAASHFLVNRPSLGPKIIAPASAAAPPVECTNVEPAKSEKPAAANQPPPHCQPIAIG